jgi:predicted dehydrogenase
VNVAASRRRSERPRLGFVGLGWIGGLRLDAVEASGAACVAALCDADAERLGAAARRHPEAAQHAQIRELLREGRLDGVVIATPNALHAPQALAALEEGLPVFVQKPLGTSRAEVELVLERARRADRLVGVDYCYRYLHGAEKLRERTRSGDLGDVHLVEAVFHNAYGPDNAWCFDPRLSGGGALLDLGVHLLDLVFWIFGPAVPRRLDGWTRDLPGHPGIDQFAGVDMVLDPDLRVRLTSSWHAHAGRDCDFRLTLHGTHAAAELRNVAGSFYDFELAIKTGRSEEVLERESREWMPRGLLAWIERLAASPRYDVSAEVSLATAGVIDRVYGGAAVPHGAEARPRAASS